MRVRLVVLILFASCACAQQDQSKILVVLADGNWSVGSQKVASGDSVPAIADLTTSEPPGHLLLSCPRAGVLSYACLHYPCRVPVCSTSVEGATVRHFDPHGGALSAIAPDSQTLFASLFRHEPKPPVLLGVREAGLLTDAVVSKSNSGIQWGPMLRRAMEGQYCFRVTHPAQETRPILTFTLDWDREANAEGTAQANLHAGLYSVLAGKPASDGSCAIDSDTTPVWVLVTPESDFQRINDNWKAYFGQFRQLESSGESPAVLIEIRHAVLAYLSDSTAK